MSDTNTLNSLLQPSSGSDIAVIAPDIGSWSYDELDTEIDRLADILAANGVKPGIPVSIVLINGYEFVATFLAVARAGAVAAPLNPAYTTDEFTFFMEDAGARVAILPNGAHPAREAAAHLGIKTIEADLDSSNGHLRVTLSANGVELTSMSDAFVPGRGRHRFVPSHLRHYQPTQRRTAPTPKPDEVHRQHQKHLCPDSQTTHH